MKQTKYDMAGKPTKAGGKRPNSGRLAKTRVEVWEQLMMLNYNPIERLVLRGLDPATDIKTQVQIDIELLGYIAAKPRPPMTQGEATAADALTDLFTTLASTGRPKPSTESDSND